MGQALAEKKMTWPDYVNEAMPRFNEIAVTHKLVQWKAESQFAIQALQKNKGLAKCAPYTVQNAIINVAAVGLTLNPADGFAYLVPEYNKQAGQNECELRISFKGLMKVATDSGAIQWVKADVVKANDTFTNNGISELPTHQMDSFGDRGETVGVYCVAKMHTGEYMVDTMPLSEIQQIRQCAKFDAVWAQWFDEMAKKAVIKRASKQWSKTDIHTTLTEAVHLLNETEGGDPNYLIYTPDQEKAFNEAVEKEDALAYLAATDGLEDRVYRALFDANKEPLRGSGGMTERTSLMNGLNSEAQACIRSSRENILGFLEAADPFGIQEELDLFSVHGLDEKIQNAFSSDEWKRIQITLKEISDEEA